VKSVSSLVFKDFIPNQVMLPPTLEEVIEENHPVWVVNDVVDGINIEPILKLYKPGDT